MFILFLQSPVLYSAGSINDLREPLEYIHTKYCKTSDLYLIGNSMGANIVANYVGEEGARCFLKAACCVQAPMKMCHFGIGPLVVHKSASKSHPPAELWPAPVLHQTGQNLFLTTDL